MPHVVFLGNNFENVLLAVLVQLELKAKGADAEGEGALEAASTGVETMKTSGKLTHVEGQINHLVRQHEEPDVQLN